MRVRRDRQRFSVASVLLCLIAAFAISPPEAFYRTQSGNRHRPARTVRLDDHDHDHSLEAVQFSFDQGWSSYCDGDPAHAVLPVRHVVAGSGGPPGELLVSPASDPLSAVVSLFRGRSPPAA